MASFDYPLGTSEGERPHAHQSLLLDMLNASLAQVSAEQDHVTYTHDVIGEVMRTGVPELQQAVVLSLPSLLTSVTGHWGAALPSVIQDKLFALVSGLFHNFNRYQLLLVYC